MDPMARASLLQGAVDKTRGSLQVASHSEAAQAWLKPALNQPDGADQVFGLLQQEVENTTFLTKLMLAREGLPAKGAPVHGDEVLQTCGRPDAASPASDFAAAAGFTEVAHNDAAGAPPTESLDQYVIVNKADVLDAIGSFVAAYLVTLPEAQKLQPAELQAALKKTFRVGPRASPPWLLNALDYLKAGVEKLESLA